MLTPGVLVSMGFEINVDLIAILPIWDTGGGWLKDSLMKIVLITFVKGHWWGSGTVLECLMFPWQLLGCVLGL